MTVGTPVGEILEIFSLTDKDGLVYNFAPLGGVPGIQHVPISDESLAIGTADPKYGLPTPQFSFQEQATWHGGRGQEDFRDASRFFDASAFTILSQEFRNAIQWKAGIGLRDGDQFLPGSVSGEDLAVDGVHYYSSPFTPDTNYSIKYVYCWIKSDDGVGGGADSFTAHIYDDNAGAPSTTQGNSASIAGTVLANRNEWYFVKFTFASAVAVTATTAYHVVMVVFTGGGPTTYTLGTDPDTTDSYSEAADPPTISGQPTLYFYATDEDVGRRFEYFDLAQARYAISINDDETASKCYINGDRGIATAGSSTTLTDSSSGTHGDGTWVADRWINAWVKIVDGVGKGKTRKITDNTTTVLTFADIGVTLDSTSQYVIYRTPYWNEIISSGLGVVLGRPVSWHNVVYFAQGASVNIRELEYDSTATSTQFHTWGANSTNRADWLVAAAIDGGKLFNYTNASGAISSAPNVAFGASLVFTAIDDVAVATSDVNNMIAFDGGIYIFTDDILYKLTANLSLEEQGINLKSMPSSYNGSAAGIAQPFLYFNWINTVQKLLGTQVISIDPNKEAGMPDNRRGVPSAIVSHPAGIFVAIDAGTGFSSVLFWDNRSWHEVFRAPVAGHRIRGLSWQGNQDANPILWIDYNGEMFYQIWPLNTITPRQDDTLEYQHQSALITSTFDGDRPTINKAYKGVTVFSENLSANAIVNYIQFQKDNNIGGSTWSSLEINNVSPREVEDFTTDASGNTFTALDNVNAVRFRCLLETNEKTTPAIIKAFSLKGFGRTPVVQQWITPIDMQSFVQENQVPVDVLNWLLDLAGGTDSVLVTSQYAPMDGKTVRVWISKIDPGFNAEEELLTLQFILHLIEI